MGCDIHSFAERKDENGWHMIADLAPFDWRSYGMYGFLAGVRNYSAIPPIAAQRDLPEDASPDVKGHHDDWNSDGHSTSWLSVAELTAFDYDRPVEDRRVTIDGNGGCTAEPGGGTMTTYREFLGEAFFNDLAKLQEAGAERIVFWFDN